MDRNGSATTIQTPWGEAGRLRDGMLRPGPGIPREDVARSQRERLFAAAVAVVAANGYERATVAEMLRLSGVSRSAFYEHFGDKEDCVLAAYGALVEMALDRARDELQRARRGANSARVALSALLEAIAAQPAVAAFCLYDIYTVGEPGRRAADRSARDLVALARDVLAGEGAGRELPETMVQGLLGGIRSVIQLYLRDHGARALPAQAEDLWEWVSAYEAPPAPLHAPRRPAAPPRAPPPIAAYGQAERIVRALAALAGERGYPAVKVAEIAARASVSQATLYSHFPDKEAMLTAALDSATTQMLAVAMPAARRSRHWARSVHAAIGGLCTFYATEPDLGRLAIVEAYAGGPPAIDLRERRVAELRSLLEPGLGAAPSLRPLAADAAIGTMWGLLYAQVDGTGPRALPDVAPLASYMVLAPFLGAEPAARVSGGRGARSGAQQSL